MASNEPQFTPSTGQSFTNWDFSSPFFESFLIIGPKSFAGQGPSEIIYQYPATNSNDNAGLHKFLFVNGSDYVTLNFKKFGEVVDHYGKYQDIIDRIVLMKNSAGEPYFTYAITFHASAFTRPAALEPKLLSEFLAARACGHTLSCKFAFAFVTRHPFSDLYFNILESLLHLETAIRLNGNDLQFIVKGKQPFDRDPVTLWPCNVFYARESLLNMLFNTSLPSFGERLGFFSYSIQPFQWKMPFPKQIPLELAKMGFSPLMTWITSEEFVQLLYYMLIEVPFLVIGADIWSVVKTVIFIGQITSPFSWQYPVVTILPAELDDLLNSPFPYIIGVSSLQEHRIESHILRIDLDSQNIIYPDLGPSNPPPSRKAHSNSPFASTDMIESPKLSEAKAKIPKRKSKISFRKANSELVETSPTLIEEPLVGAKHLPNEGILYRLINPLMAPSNRENLIKSHAQIEEFMSAVSHFLTDTIILKIESLTSAVFNIRGGFEAKFDIKAFKDSFPNDQQFINDFADTQAFSVIQGQVGDTKIKEINGSKQHKEPNKAHLMTMGTWAAQMLKEINNGGQDTKAGSKLSFFDSYS